MVAGAEIDPKLKIDGMNVLDVWLGKAKSPDRTLYWQWDEGGDLQYAAMHGDMKMVITGGNNPELFNVENDPAERRNLAWEYPKEVKTMGDGVKAWMATESDAAKIGAAHDSACDEQGGSRLINAGARLP